jgi:hypothetical protein
MPLAVLHAKAVVADDEAVLVTSANLTEAALDRNIELGVEPPFSPQLPPASMDPTHAAPAAEQAA